MKTNESYLIKTYANSYLKERCLNRKTLLYGSGIEASQLAVQLSAIGINIEWFIDDECAGARIGDKEVRHSMDIVYEEVDNIFVIICNEKERYNISRLKFLDMGLVEDVNFTYYMEIPQHQETYHYDVTLSHGRTRGQLEGFELFGDFENIKAKKIVALGGSTTESTFCFVKGWVQYLSELLQQNNVPAIVYGGGIAGYTSTQELLKLIRDVIPLKPDIVIAYGGYNDLCYFPKLDEPERYKRPFISKFQIDFMNKIISRSSKEEDMTIFVSSQNDKSRNKIYYGLRNDKTASELWTDNMRMMHAISKEFGISFFSFFQPFYHSSPGNYKTTELQEIIFRRRWNNRDDKDKIAFMQSEANDIINEIKNKYDFITDLTGIFSEYEGIYMDSVHVYERGNKIIAENIYNELILHLKGR